MSLIVSLRIPDGIVVAADSLATSNNLIEIVADGIEFECPSCHNKIQGGKIASPKFPIPIPASSYTQKLFNLHKKFAITTHGLGFLNNRSIYYHIKTLEQQHDANANDELKKKVDIIVNYFETQLGIQYPKYKSEAPKEWRPLGFHVHGYEGADDLIPVTYEISLGRTNIVTPQKGIGCTVGGDIRIVTKLWEIGRDDPRLNFKYTLLSLQDAIDLCEFLISTTSTFQRFSNMQMSVGGEIDIALVTPFHQFKWIKRKSLMERLENDE